MWNPLDGLSSVKVAIKLLNYGAIIPTYGSEEAAGADIYSMDRLSISPGETVAVSTGIAIQLPKGFEAQCRSRSGMALNYSIFVLNSPGTIDSDYRGEIKVILHNAGDETFDVNKEDRIAQLVVVPVFRVIFDMVSELGQTDRGAGGFGSTGA